jgi:retron-type reverse transcriptase
MSFVKFSSEYEHIISVQNLLEAWKEFVLGKKSRKDVQEFQRHLMSNIIALHTDLISKTYRHSLYEAFNISDPKPRNIHKASVRDRLLHHAIYKNMYPFFNRVFIADSYSCRFGKGTHKALNRFQDFARKASKNHSKTIWVLKCDIKKFFASIDHDILIRILNKYIVDKDIVWLLTEIITSFYSTGQGKGLPLGNLTSQLLVNVYMNEFDQYVKHILKQKYYVRYADDFIFVGTNKKNLVEVLHKVNAFLYERLALVVHRKKVSLETFASGVDFLGWVHFTDHCVLRTSTKKRMFKKLQNPSDSRLGSYLGMLSHGNSLKIRNKVDLLRRGK